MKIDTDSRTAPTVWHREDLDDCHSGALLIDGRLYGTACRQGGRQFYCVDFLTGKNIKVDKTMGKTCITVADSMIYALNFQGTMRLMAVTPDGFELVSSRSRSPSRAMTGLVHEFATGRGVRQTSRPRCPSKAIRSESSSSPLLPRSNCTITLPSCTTSDVAMPYMLFPLVRMASTFA